MKRNLLMRLLATAAQGHRTFGVLGLLVMCLCAPGAQAAPEVKSGLAAEAQALVEQLSRGEFAEAHKAFAPEVKGKLSQPALAATWTSVTTQLGAYQRQLGTSVATSGPYTKVRVSCAFAHMKMDVEVVFNGARQVVGFFIKPPMPKVGKSMRAQTPKAPFPYEVTEVDYPSTGDVGRFGGTLTRPRGATKAPAVLLITGSGLQDRDSTLFGHKPFAVIADHLTRAGMIVLRVDDRGIGKTTVSPKGSTIQKHVQDVAAGLAFLRKYDGVDPQRVGLIGHSEGGLIAAMLAGQSKDVAFVVMLAGAGLSGAEINPLQVEAALRSQGRVPEANIRVIVKMQRDLMTSLEGGASNETLLGQLKALQGESLKLVPEAARSRLTKEILEGEIKAQYAAITSAWFRSFVTTDPAPILKSVSCPLLALIGSKDTQVPAQPNLEAIRLALKTGGNVGAETRTLDGLNHLFQRAKTGAVSEYTTIAETFNEGALKEITSWLLKTTRLPQ